MTVEEIARDLIRLCSENRETEAIEKYYAPNIRSYEAGESEVEEGIEGIFGKAKWFDSAFETHRKEFRGPWIFNEQFAIEFTYEVTERSSGNRMKINEIGVYETKAGKIEVERFFMAGTMSAAGVHVIE